MIILPQTKLIKWATTSKQYYIDLGYKCENLNDIFEVDVTDLSHGSTIKVDVECDFCGKIKQIVYKSYLKLQSDKYCCPDCLSHKKKTRNKDGKLEFIEIPYRNKDWLFNEYITNNRQAQDIANECGINLRTLREWIASFELCNKQEKDISHIKKEILEDLYITQMKSSIDIGKIFDISEHLVMILLRSYDIKIPSRSELTNRYLYKKGGIEFLRAYGGKEENRIITSCRLQGINVSEFDGFRKSKIELIRTSSIYQEWRRFVFERDKYTCQCCGKVGGDLQAHHIENFSSNEDKRFDIENGVTMCISCHSPSYKDSFHSVYGVYNNTLEQLNNYIESKKLGVA